MFAEKTSARTTADNDGAQHIPYTIRRYIVAHLTPTVDTHPRPMRCARRGLVAVHLLAAGHGRGSSAYTYHISPGTFHSFIHSSIYPLTFTSTSTTTYTYPTAYILAYHIHMYIDPSACLSVCLSGEYLGIRPHSTLHTAYLELPRD